MAKAIKSAPVKSKPAVKVAVKAAGKTAEKSAAKTKAAAKSAVKSVAKSIARPALKAGGKSTQKAAPPRAYRDLHEHLEALDKAGLLITVDRQINKDTEMHPLVRWQFRGGINEPDRKACLFTNVVDSKGKKYDIPVVVGALAATRKIYSVGMGCEIEDIGKAIE